MAIQLKELFNKKLIEAIASRIEGQANHFNKEAWIANCLKGIKPLELKERSNFLGDQIKLILTGTIEEEKKRILALLGPEIKENTEIGYMPFENMPISSMLSNWRFSKSELPVVFEILKPLTKAFTSEFSIRPILKKYPNETFEFLLDCAIDQNSHVRRLASEGCRPYLPWDEKIQFLEDDPSPIFMVLKKLIHDESKYVQKSVANNLNDISKKHPQKVIEFLKNQQKSKSSQWITKQALRTLIKNGNTEALKLLGYQKIDLSQFDFELSSKSIHIDEKLIMELRIPAQNKLLNLLIDYAIYYVSKTGIQRRKVFKWTTLNGTNEFKLKKTVSFKKINTRVYYPGTHKIELLINGEPMAARSFELLLSK